MVQRLMNVFLNFSYFQNITGQKICLFRIYENFEYKARLTLPYEENKKNLQVVENEAIGFCLIHLTEEKQNGISLLISGKSLYKISKFMKIVIIFMNILNFISFKVPFIFHLNLHLKCNYL